MAYHSNGSETATENQGRSTKHVLIVDDNYASRLVAKVLLEREKYAVTLAKDGQTAIDIASVQPLDLVLMDIQMPSMSGIVAARKIRALANNNQFVPIIALTAYADKTVLTEVQAAGMSELLTKPLKLGQLRSAWEHAENNKHRPLVIVTPKTIVTNFSKSMLNTSVLGPLVAAAPPPVLQRLFDRYFESAELFISTINTNSKSGAKGDPQALTIVRKQAHSLKGASANVGFLKLSRLAAQLQNTSASNLTKIAPELAPVLAQSRVELERYLSGQLSR